MSWSGLVHELDTWAAGGRVAEFWWRDDDAADTTDALQRLIALHGGHGVPLLLAVIPARAQKRLADRLRAEADIAVCQHGWAHLNHSSPGRAKAELGPDRPAPYVLGELARGALTLDRIFGNGWLRVLVPPHNRIAPEVAAGLRAAGYVGLSTDKPRRAGLTDVAQVNTHVDIMNWGTRAFLGDEPALELAIRHLRDKRTGQADPDEPTGLLTHHLAHDEAAWAFTDRFLGAIATHRAARWRDVRDIFTPAKEAA
jgi:peptidoglycan/xylan/chitin deacetylase (PgdA/CDA1 family)